MDWIVYLILGCVFVMFLTYEITVIRQHSSYMSILRDFRLKIADFRIKEIEFNNFKEKRDE